MGQCISRTASNDDASGSKMSSSSTSPVVIPARGKHTATLIFLHGLGDTGHGWASSLAEIRSDNMRIVCPTAPTLPVTLNSGFHMPAWFDLMSLDPNGAEDEEGIKRSVTAVEKLIADEITNGVPADRIVLGGFSQGGALALYSGLTGKQKLAGLVAFSCWMPLHKKVPEILAQRDIPIFQCHGDCDPVVPYKWGQMTSTVLKKLVTTHEFKSYQGLGHSSSSDELDDLQTFLNERLK